MNRHFVVALSLGLAVVSLMAMGCARQPQTTPEATPTENVVVVVITATTQPTFAPTPTETGEPTITPLATFTPLGLNSPTATPRATATRTPARPPATESTPRASKSATAAPPAARPTALPQQNKYPAPAALSPTEGDSFRDGSDIQFYFGSNGPLAPNECYLLHVEMVNPNATSGGIAGDDFFDGAHCGDQSAPGTRLKYVLFRSKFSNAPNYGTIEAQSLAAGQTDLLKVRWYVRIVQDNGLSSDGVHHNTAPLSPPSATLECDFHPQ